jgi:biotin carboxyl carrier protein
MSYLANPLPISIMPPTNYQVTINERDYPLTTDELENLDLLPLGNGSYHLLQDGQSYHIELLKLDLDQKELLLRINGREQHLLLKDATDLLVRQLGFSAVNTQKSKNIIAPMPGLVLDILVEKGSTVEADTPLLILEAMKMENVLKAEGEGIVKSINVTKGDAVEKRQLLIEIE